MYNPNIPSLHTSASWANSGWGHSHQLPTKLHFVGHGKLLWSQVGHSNRAKVTQGSDSWICIT